MRNMLLNVGSSHFATLSSVVHEVSVCPTSPPFPVALLKNCIILILVSCKGVNIRLTELFPEPVGPISLMNQKNIRPISWAPKSYSRNYGFVFVQQLLLVGDHWRCVIYFGIRINHHDHVCGKADHSPDSTTLFSGVCEGCTFVSNGWLNR